MVADAFVSSVATAHGIMAFITLLSSETLVDHGPAGEEYIVAIRDSVQRLVALDIEFGGDTVSTYAICIFLAVRRQLRPGSYRAGCERDLYAAAAELAELTGWLLSSHPRQTPVETATSTSASCCTHSFE